MTINIIAKLYSIFQSLKLYSIFYVFVACLYCNEVNELTDKHSLKPKTKRSQINRKQDMWKRVLNLQSRNKSEKNVL